MNTKKLPDWAIYNKAEDIIVVDPDVVYPLYLRKLGYSVKRLTGSELEVARRCFTEDLLLLTGPGLRLRIPKTVGGIWKLSKYPAGMPIDWRAEYERISRVSGD